MPFITYFHELPTIMYFHNFLGGAHTFSLLRVSVLLYIMQSAITRAVIVQVVQHEVDYLRL